jgi:hypothetical protein
LSGIDYNRTLESKKYALDSSDDRKKCSVEEIITDELIAIETDMNKNYKGYLDIINEEKNNKMNVILNRSTEKDLKLAPTWFEMILNLLTSRTDLRKINKSTNNNIINRIVNEGFLPIGNDFTNKRKKGNEEEENMKLAAKLR